MSAVWQTVYVRHRDRRTRGHLLADLASDTTYCCADTGGDPDTTASCSPCSLSEASNTSDLW